MSEQMGRDYAQALITIRELRAQLEAARKDANRLHSALAQLLRYSAVRNAVEVEHLDTALAAQGAHLNAFEGDAARSAQSDRNSQRQEG